MHRCLHAFLAVALLAALPLAQLHGHAAGIAGGDVRVQAGSSAAAALAAPDCTVCAGARVHTVAAVPSAPSSACQRTRLGFATPWRAARVCTLAGLAPRGPPSVG